MGAAASALARVLVTEVVSELVLTVVSTTVDSITAMGTAVVDSVAQVSDVVASSSWETMLASGQTAARQAVRDSLEQVKQQFKTVYDLVTKPRESWNEYVQTLTDRTPITQSDAANALQQMKRAISITCDVVADSETAANSAESILGHVSAFMNITAYAHTCGGDAEVRREVHTELTDVKNAVQQLNERALIKQGEDQLKKTGTLLGTEILQRSLSKYLPVGCVKAGSQDVPVQEVASTLSSDGKDVNILLGHVSMAQACTVLDTPGSASFKCPQNPAGGQNKILNPCTQRRALGMLFPEPSTQVNLVPGYLFPIEMPCGTNEMRSVYSFREAYACYETMLQAARLDWRHTTGWDLITDRPCDVTLYAGTTNPKDEYCTVFPVERQEEDSTALPYTTDVFGKNTVYADVPFCTSLNQSVHTLLTALSNDRPDFPVIRFNWAPNERNCAQERGHPSLTAFLESPSLALPSPSRDRLQTVEGLSVASVLGIYVHLVGFVLLCGYYYFRTPTPSSAPRAASPMRLRQRTADKRRSHV